MAEEIIVAFVFGVFIGFWMRPRVIGYIKRKTEQVNKKLQVLT